MDDERGTTIGEMHKQIEAILCEPTLHPYAVLAAKANHAAEQLAKALAELWLAHGDWLRAAEGGADCGPAISRTAAAENAAAALLDRLDPGWRDAPAAHGRERGE